MVNFIKKSENVAAKEGRGAFNSPYIFRAIGDIEAKFGEIAPDVYKPNGFLRERIIDQVGNNL